jgi:hypothetical protein
MLSRPIVAALLTAFTILLSAATALLASAGTAGAAGAAAGSAPPAQARLAGSAAAVSHTAAATQPLTPAQIHSAYALPLRGARGQVIAVVSAYDDPAAQADLNAYDKRYDLPPCTTADGCLRKLNEKGASSPLPPKDLSGGKWITESSLGIEVAHGVCQSCRIILMEVDTPENSDFSQTVAAAAKAGATVIVTTFTPPEIPGDSAYVLDYTNAHAVVVAATGDPSTGGKWGYTGSLNFPASLPNVLAVGGTTLSLGAGGAYAGEQVWPGTVSGCSFSQPAPVWQDRIKTAADCGTMRADVDLAAVADPGVVVHITGAGVSGGPWYVASGTSVSAPVIAGVIGLAGSLGPAEAQTLYARALSDPGAFHDILKGENAPGCVAPICKAGPGWSGPTGLGTPFGLAAFLPSGGALAAGHADLSVSPSKVTAGRRWTATVTIKNGNPVAVTGTLVLQFASGTLKLSPLETLRRTLTVAPRYRSLLKRLGSVAVSLQLRVRGPVGRTDTVSRRVLLSAP